MICVGMCRTIYVREDIVDATMQSRDGQRSQRGGRGGPGRQRGGRHTGSRGAFSERSNRGPSVDYEGSDPRYGGNGVDKVRDNYWAR